MLRYVNVVLAALLLVLIVLHAKQDRRNTRLQKVIRDCADVVDQG